MRGVSRQRKARSFVRDLAIAHCDRCAKVEL
jgi:hypothetical protein